jgi:type IV secretion system protein VirB9
VNKAVLASIFAAGVGFLTAVSTPARAQVVQQYEYAPDAIYQVRTGLGITTQIELSANEHVVDFSTGFSDGWELTRRDNVFYLKPSYQGRSGRNAGAAQHAAGERSPVQL